MRRIAWQLEGELLDYWVTVANKGFNPRLTGDRYPRWSSDWELAGRLVVQHHIELCWMQNDMCAAHLPGKTYVLSHDPREAIARTLVQTKLGFNRIYNEKFPPVGTEDL